MQTSLQYGQGELPLTIPGERVTVLRPQYVPGLADEAAAFEEAVTRPIDSPPLTELITSTDRVAIVIPDITRALPTARLLPWLFAALPHVPAENVVIINGTGTHRANTPDELAAMVGPEIYQRYRVINHDAFAADTLTLAGHSLDGQPVHLNREYVASDKRIVLGFIEPHFMAGFSGGYKGIFPGVAGIDAIMHYHRAEIIGHPRSTWGITEDNPTLTQIRHNGALVPLDFCLNVTLNHQRQITRFFCGQPDAAHAAGAAFARETAMVACSEPFPLVVTSNSGYPLDLNLYQSVKGMSAAAEVVTDGGEIVTAARCNDGLPEHGNFARLLRESESPAQLLERIMQPGFRLHDQWQAQKLAVILQRARVSLYSELPPVAVEGAYLQPIADLDEHLAAVVNKLGPDAPIAVLPEGPMTIPYLEV